MTSEDFGEHSSIGSSPLLVVLWVWILDVLLLHAN